MMSRSPSPSSSVYYSATSDMEEETSPNVKTEGGDAQALAISRTSEVVPTVASIVKSETDGVALDLSSRLLTPLGSRGRIDSRSGSVRRSSTVEVVLERRLDVLQRQDRRSLARSPMRIAIPDTQKTVVEESVSQEITSTSGASQQELEQHKSIRVKTEDAHPPAIIKLEPVSSENKVKLLALDNPDVKLLSGSSLSAESVNFRLDAIGLDPYPVILPDSIKLSEVSRDWMSVTFGGASQGMHPAIDKKKFKHGIDNFYYITYDYNPVAPKRPGYPGLQFSSRPGAFITGQPAVKKLLCRLAAGRWLYMGEYETTVSNPLTKDEWLAQGSKFHDFWSNNIAKKNFGRISRFRIDYRRRNVRSPSEEELDKALDKWREVAVTPAQIHQAFCAGEEQLGVYALKCIDYDEDFQRKLNGMPKGWTRPTTDKTPKKKVEKSKSARTPKTPRTPVRKRKSKAISDSDSDSDFSPTRQQRSSAKRRKLAAPRVAETDDESDEDIKEVSSQEFYED